MKLAGFCACRLRRALALCFLCAPAFLAVQSQPQQQKPGDKNNPVLVELFTSEGCSDCPPADALLAELDRTQFVPGVHAIVLSEHVTYWNHLGWRDPFSLDAATQRQEEYVRRFGLDSSYTPQIVVDGATQFVGSDARALRAALTGAVARQKQQLTIEGVRWIGGLLEFSLRGDLVRGTKLVAVLASDATRSEVARGENAGRTLHHTAVACVMQEFSAESMDGRRLNLDTKSFAPQGKVVLPARLVVFLNDRSTGHVLAVAEEKVPQ